MQTDKPLVDQEYQLEKFQGKGGWTYAAIPEIVPGKNTPFGWVKVSGHIDQYPISHCHLMPMGQGRLFLPVKSEIRKKIGKKEGDWVRIVLFLEERPQGIPDEILECFEHEDPKVLENFRRLSDGRQKAYLDWIYNAKQDDTKAERIARMMDELHKSHNTASQK
jgi:hypothetical protein